MHYQKTPADAKNPDLIGHLTNPTSFEVSYALRKHYSQSGNTEKVVALDRILETHKEVKKLCNGENRLKKFTGVHVLPDGTFPRRKRGVICNWNPNARQALFLLADQFNKKPDSHWGKVLRHNKEKLREKHPDVVVENGKKRYTNGHIHKMACWRTLTQFVEWLYKAWDELVEGEAASKAA